MVDYGEFVISGALIQIVLEFIVVSGLVLNLRKENRVLSRKMIVRDCGGFQLMMMMR